MEIPLSIKPASLSAAAHAPKAIRWGAAPRGAQYEEMLRPEGPIFFAGEHLSYVPFWQEGAALSAHEALRLLASQAQERRAA